MKNIEINTTSIDDLMEEMSMVKTHYIQQKKKRMKQIKISKGAQFNFSPTKKQSHSMQYSSTPASPAKTQYSFLSTFVNIKEARYKIGPTTDTYNLKNIEFPDIWSKRKTPKIKLNPQDSQFTQSLDGRINPSKQIDRSYVKQSWNKFMNLHSINKSVHYIEDEIKKGKKNTKKLSKDVTEQNIEGWKSFYHQQEQINLPKS